MLDEREPHDVPALHRAAQQGNIDGRIAEERRGGHGRPHVAQEGSCDPIGAVSVGPLVARQPLADRPKHLPWLDGMVLLVALAPDAVDEIADCCAGRLRNRNGAGACRFDPG